VAFSEHQDNLSAVKKVLVDGGYTGQPFAAAVRKMLEGDGRGCQTKRTAHIYSDAQTVGCRALFRLVGKMSTIMEKLRAKTQYQRAICDLGVSGLVNPKIVNRLSEPLFRRGCRKSSAGEDACATPRGWVVFLVPRRCVGTRKLRAAAGHGVRKPSGRRRSQPDRSRRDSWVGPIVASTRSPRRVVHKTGLWLRMGYSTLCQPKAEMSSLSKAELLCPLLRVDNLQRRLVICRP